MRLQHILNRHFAQVCFGATAAGLLAACATPGGQEGSAAASAASAPAAAAVAAASPASAASGAETAPVAGKGGPGGPPGGPPPFAVVTKEAVQSPGLFPIWRKDHEVLLEIPADMLDKPFLFSVSYSHSIGERGLYGSQMGPGWLASFRKVGNNQVQLIALNTEYTAKSPAMKATVDQAFSHSLLAATSVVSAPHPERKSLLIDASFLLSDIPGYSTQLESAFRLPYGLDKANSFIESTRGTDDLTTLNARIHFATPRLPAPPLLPPPVPLPSPPSTTPDARSMFVGFVYSFAKAAATPMPVRRTDPRLGHFFNTVSDLSTDLKSNPKAFYVKRWRLEKKDPAAALSEPKQPIVYWLDKNIPQAYRASVTAGILEWNKAFEKIGFKDAVVAKQQPDDADWDNMDARHASIRWFVGADVGFAIGPSRSDPRTGEIFDADIGMSDVFGRGSRRFIVEDVKGYGQSAQTSQDRLAQLMSNWRESGAAYCDYAAEAASEMNFALDILEARGDIAPDSPEAEAFVQGVIKDTIMHEVGHTLGLKHNFKASTVVTQAQLRDKAFTDQYGISGSVMDYNAYNLSVKGEADANLNNTALGPYDYWAIEYAYKQVDPKEEESEISKIAARSTDPLLAYADDADAGGVPGMEGIDPLVNRFDLGDDPLAYYKKRLQLSRELWQRVQDRAPQAGDDPLRARRVLVSGFRQLGRAAELVGKYVGGMVALRDLPGTTGRPAYAPMDPAKQREALQFLAKGLFSADSFRFKPQFLASLSPDYNEWQRGGPVSIPAAAIQTQSLALDRVMSAGTAYRLLELPLYLSDAAKKGAISLNEVYGTVQQAVWSELATGSDIEPMRRNLQREHLRRVQALLVRPGPLPADAVSLVRMHATELQAQLIKAKASAKLSVEARAHLADSLNSLTEALKASMTRS